MVFDGGHDPLMASDGGFLSPSSWDDVLWFQGTSILQNRWAVVVGPPGPWRRLDSMWKSMKAQALRWARVTRKIQIVGHRLIGFLSSTHNRHGDEANLSASGLYLMKNQDQNRRGEFYRIEHGCKIALAGSLLISGHRVGSGPGKALMGRLARPGDRLCIRLPRRPRRKHKTGFGPQSE
jgi:hypothetical protein